MVIVKASSSNIGSENITQAKAIRRSNIMNANNNNNSNSGSKVSNINGNIINLTVNNYVNATAGG